jgi:5-methylcytosine-specific restriction endonuclease McrA
MFSNYPTNRQQKGIARHNIEYLKLKEKILASNTQCCYCGSSLNLQVHHILPLHTYPTLIADENNLIVLCSGSDRFSGCHKKYGHLNDFSKHNPNIKNICKIKMILPE